jgi:membrane protein DedA with SNARE-associated domain
VWIFRVTAWLSQLHDGCRHQPFLRLRHQTSFIAATRRQGTTRLMYLLVFLGSLAVDLIPVVAPPAWIVMTFLLVKYHLDFWLVLAVGVPGSALGRYFFGLYIQNFFAKVVARRKKDDLRYAGKKLNRHWWQTWLFVFGYTLTPLSTTALFTAAGMAKVPIVRLIPPFLAGKFISDAVMVMAGRYAAGGLIHPLDGALGWRSLLTGGIALLITAAFLFLDWHALLAKHTLKFNFSVWK